MQTKRCLADFAGAWRLEKHIRQDDGGEAWFEGQATWTPTGDGLAYCEEGLLRMGQAAPVKAERRYLWTVPLRVSFADGRFFHDVPAYGGQALHDCPPDTYLVTYAFTKWPEWRALWRVTGPRKAYRMDCLYRRLDT